MSLHVLFKNDKKTIPITPGTPMADLLSRALTLYKVPQENHSLYTLTYNQKPINLTIPFRLSGIPSGSRVSIVQNSTGVNVTSEIRIAIQLSDGKRLQGNFKTTSTLWDIFLYFESNNGVNLVRQVDQETGNYKSPVAVIINKEVSSMEELQQYSLRKLMIMESCLINLKFNQTNTKFEDIKDTIDNYQPLGFLEKASQIMEQLKGVSYDEFIKQQQQTSPTQNTQSKISNTTTTTTTATPTKTNEPITSPKDNQQVPPSPPMDTSNNKEDSPMDIKQDSPTSTTSTTSTTSSTAQTSPPQPQQPPPFEQPEIERNFKIHIPKYEDIDIKSIHFDGVMTADDFKRLIEANKRIKREKDEKEAMLRTKKMRDIDEDKKTRKYTTTSIRVCLPDHKILEMTFHPREPISRLYLYLSTKFVEPLPNFYLYITPPPKELDPNVTFYSQQLYPRAKIFVGLRKDSPPLQLIPEVEDMFTSSYNSAINDLLGQQQQQQQQQQQKGDSTSTNETSTTSTTTTTTTTTNTISSEQSTPTSVSTTSNLVNNSSSSSNNSNRDIDMNDSTNTEEKISVGGTKIPSWFSKGKKM